MGKTVLRGYIEVCDEDLDLVTDALPEHIESTKNEKGCLVFHVNQDPVNPNLFSVYEEFVDQASFEFHQERVRNGKWGKITKNVKRNYDITTKEAVD